MSKRLLSKENGIEYWIESDGYGNHTVTRVEDLAPILDQNQKLRNDTEYARKGIKDGYQHVGTIPNMILEMWYNQGLIKHPLLQAPGDPERALALINSRDWNYLKTTAGTA